MGYAEPIPETALIERLAEAMRDIGDGATLEALCARGFTRQQVETFAPAARDLIASSEDAR